MTFIGLLPIAALVLTISLYIRSGHDRTEAILLGAVAWLFAIALGSEAIGLVGAIGFPAFVGAWGFFIAALTALHARLPRRATRPGDVGVGGFAASERLALVVLGLIGAVTLLLALVCPPNNWDSQTYHLPRIEHWIQDRSFAFYPTSIGRQIALQSLAETIVLQFRLLSGDDRLDNLVQWLAAVGSAVAVANIALRLGAARRGAILAALAAAALPTMILESTNTKNDIVVAFLLLCTAERLLAWRESASLHDAVYMAMAAGLALATKGTAYLIGVPLGVWFLAGLVRKRRAMILPFLICGSLVLLPNIALYMRNLSFYGSPLGAVGRSTNNVAYGLGPLALNVTRNMAVNLTCFDPDVDRRITAAVAGFLHALGLDPSDPATTFPFTKFGLFPWQTHEDVAGNPLELLLAIVAVLAALRPGATTIQRRYAVLVVAAALVFVIVLRWQPWITRLQLPLFALAAPLAGCLAPVQRRECFALPLVVLLMLFAMPALLVNQTRALLPFVRWGIASSVLSESQDQIRFMAYADLRPQYEAAARYALANGHHEIGLVMGGDDWEYPLWRLLRRAEIKPLRIEHLETGAEAAKVGYPLGPFNPSLVISTSPKRPPELVIDGRKWMRQLELPALSLYTGDAQLPIGSSFMPAPIDAHRER